MKVGAMVVDRGAYFLSEIVKEGQLGWLRLEPEILSERGFLPADIGTYVLRRHGSHLIGQRSQKKQSSIVAIFEILFPLVHAWTLTILDFMVRTEDSASQMLEIHFGSHPRLLGSFSHL